MTIEKIEDVKVELSEKVEEEEIAVIKDVLGRIPPQHKELIDEVIIDSTFDSEKFTNALWGNVRCSKGGPTGHADLSEGDGNIIRVDYKLTKMWGRGLAFSFAHEVGHIVGGLLHQDRSEGFADKYASQLLEGADSDEKE